MPKLVIEVGLTDDQIDWLDDNADRVFHCSGSQGNVAIQKLMETAIEESIDELRYRERRFHWIEKLARRLALESSGFNDILDMRFLRSPYYDIHVFIETQFIEGGYQPSLWELCDKIKEEANKSEQMEQDHKVVEVLPIYRWYGNSDTLLAHAYRRTGKKAFMKVDDYVEPELTQEQKNWLMGRKDS